MARSFKLPDLGEGIHEGEVLAVRVTVGDAVSEGDIILEVETDKAAVEIPSPYTAKIEEIRVQTGDVVKVGHVLMLFSGEG
ncbi:MAG: 2-oxo acid dehydrogenase subunit E2, partial [Desulfobacterales bacterium]|nr:2-oxo acid dehydrogenase subunit E2 [Desulfobacterales bacterium]